MNCTDWEERIATDPDDGAVQQHVAECVACQVFASGLRQTLAELKAMHDDPIAPAHYAAVRARVMSEIVNSRWRRAWRWAALAAGLLAAAFGLTVERRLQVDEIRLPVVASAPPAPVSPAPAAGRPRPPTEIAKARRRPAPRMQRKPPAVPEEVLVKLETDNPDVVIFWIAETKGEDR